MGADFHTEMQIAPAIALLALLAICSGQPVIPTISAPRCPVRYQCPEPCWDDRAMDCLERMNRTVACCFSDDCYSSQNNVRYNAALCCGSTGNPSQCKANPDLDVQARLQAVRPSVAAKSPVSQ